MPGVHARRRAIAGLLGDGVRALRGLCALTVRCMTRELVAVIRGSDGGRRMYAAGEALPRLYLDRFRTQTYNDRVHHPGAWNKLAVVAREDDDQTILNHALIQSRRRHRRT